MQPTNLQSEYIKDETTSLTSFEIFETGTNGTEISWEKFQKIWKLLNFRKANHSTENSRNSGMKINWNRNFQEKNFENLGIPHG